MSNVETRWLEEYRRGLTALPSVRVVRCSLVRVRAGRWFLEVRGVGLTPGPLPLHVSVDGERLDKVKISRDGRRLIGYARRPGRVVVDYGSVCIEVPPWRQAKLAR